MYIYNTKTHSKDLFVPIRKNKITMYVCGPTVYDYIHIGNARSLVCFDVVYRILKHKYKNVAYVRNITDVDDKIINRSSSSNMQPSQIADIFTAAFHRHATALCCLPPTHEPKATDHIPQMIAMIEGLIKNGHAYVSHGHVYFDISTYKAYGDLSKKNIEELALGIRVEISTHKKNSADFVLWKPSNNNDSCAWNSPWGLGRPGWHIECSAMAKTYLGDAFDIHAGGVDLMFPHHENEIAQTCCSDHKAKSANYWMHNGFLLFDGDKMSKSIGNVVTVKELLEAGVKGEVIRYALLSVHYRKQLHWNKTLLCAAQNDLNRLYAALEDFNFQEGDREDIKLSEEFMGYLYDDVNIHGAFLVLHNIVGSINKAAHTEQKKLLQNLLYHHGRFLGFFNEDYEHWFMVAEDEAIEDMIRRRNTAKRGKDYALADQIREQLRNKNIQLFDHPDGSSTWRKIGN